MSLPESYSTRERKGTMPLDPYTRQRKQLRFWVPLICGLLGAALVGLLLWLMY